MQNEKKLIKKMCPVCEKDFYTKDVRQIYCSTACKSKIAKIREKQRIQEGGIKMGRPKKHKKQVNVDLVEVATKARQAGMSYGKYVAMCYAKGIKV